MIRMNPNQKEIAVRSGFLEKFDVTIMKKIGNDVYIYAYDNSLLTKKRLDMIFKIFDNNGNGSICVKEFKKIFSNLNCEDSVWQKLIN